MEIPSIYSEFIEALQSNDFKTKKPRKWILNFPTWHEVTSDFIYIPYYTPKRNC